MRNQPSWKFCSLTSVKSSKVQTQQNTLRFRHSASQQCSIYKHAQNPPKRKWQQLKSTIPAPCCKLIRQEYVTGPMHSSILLKHTDGNHKQSRNEELSGEKSDISKCVPFYSHGWAHHVSEEEIQKAKKINTGCKKPKASRAVQCRILGYSTLYEVPDSTSSTVWFKNTFTCYNLESKKVMCRHDCLWKKRTVDRKMKQPTNTKPDLPLGNPEQSAHSAAVQKCTDSISSKIPTPYSY